MYGDEEIAMCTTYLNVEKSLFGDSLDAKILMRAAVMPFPHVCERIETCGVPEPTFLLLVIP